ncbi:MAG: DNA repair protein RecO [Lachnospiraceae bacterium]|nr:DNA repair protein RecO [Lachnospiraceae bacterium]
MAGGVTLTGIVLKVSPVGERDRHVLLLTKERGKISAFARGARRQDSPLLGACQPFAYGNFQVYEGRNSYTIVRADILSYFEELRDDLTTICYGQYFCELANYFTRENLPAIEVMQLLYQSLRALTKKSLPPNLVRSICELRMIALAGYAPQVFQCVSCGQTGKINCFSVRAGGLLCPDCKKLDLKGREVSDTVLYAMRFILQTPLAKLYTFVLSPEAQEELADLMKDYYERYVECEFQSLSLLDFQI